MKALLLLPALALATAAAEFGPADHPAFPGDGFEVLFQDGEGLAKLETEGNWIVQEDGSLALVPRPGEKGWERYGSYLWLPGDYEDFIVDFEFKYPEGGNSGLYFRISDEVDATASGFEVQILDCFGQKKKLTHHDMGGVIRTQAPLGNASKPPGEWGRMTVELDAGRLRVIVNGKLVQDFELAKEKEESKELAAEGRIAIQDHGQPLAVRKIQVKRL